MKLVVSVSPHIHRDISISRIMYTIIIALVPAFLWSVHSFGIRALWLVIISCGVACLTEAVFQILIKRKRTYLDGSAILTGMLLAFNLPVKIPLWVPVMGAIFAIVVAKQAFGGLGYNFINPALAGRAFIVASWPQAISGLWSAPKFGAISDMNAITNVAPLGVLKMNSGNPLLVSMLDSGESIRSLFLGVCGGTLGEVSCLFLLLGGLFLIAMKYIDWRIPLSYIGTVGILMQVFYIFGITPVNGIFHILVGGLFLGAFFMATDYVTSPITREGRWFFGVGCGVLTVLIRLWGAQPDGVCYAILIMNCFVPLIERSLKPKIFGKIKILS